MTYGTPSYAPSEPIEVQLRQRKRRACASLDGEEAEYQPGATMSVVAAPELFRRRSSVSSFGRRSSVSSFPSTAILAPVVSSDPMDRQAGEPELQSPAAPVLLDRATQKSLIAHEVRHQNKHLRRWLKERDRQLHQAASSRAQTDFFFGSTSASLSVAHIARKKSETAAELDSCLLPGTPESPVSLDDTSGVSMAPSSPILVPAGSPCHSDNEDEISAPPARPVNSILDSPQSDTDRVFKGYLGRYGDVSIGDWVKVEQSVNDQRLLQFAVVRYFYVDASTGAKRASISPLVPEIWPLPESLTFRCFRIGDTMDIPATAVGPRLEMRVPMSNHSAFNFLTSSSS